MAVCLVMLFGSLPALADDVFFYQKALDALQDCRINKAESLLAQIKNLADIEDLQKKLTSLRAMKSRVDKLYGQAKTEYAQCQYADAAEHLEQAIYTPGCRRIRQQLSDKLNDILNAAYDDNRIKKQWAVLAQDIVQAETAGDPKIMLAGLSQLAALNGKATCPVLNQRIASFLGKKQKRYAQVEYTNRPYAAVANALKRCDIEQAGELINALPEGKRKQKFSSQLKNMDALREETTQGIKKSESDRALCQFSSTLEVLEALRSKQQCEKSINDLDIRIARARTDFQQDQQVIALLRDARESASEEDAYASLVKARRLNVCPPQQQSLDTLVAEKTASLPPGRQVARMDCSAWEHGEAYWLEKEHRPGCRCSAGYEPNEQKTGCAPTPKTQVSILDCSTWKNAEARWFEQAREAACFCRKGFRWKQDYTACEPVPLDR